MRYRAVCWITLSTESVVLLWKRRRWVWIQVILIGGSIGKLCANISRNIIFWYAAVFCKLANVFWRYAQCLFWCLPCPALLQRSDPPVVVGSLALYPLSVCFCTWEEGCQILWEKQAARSMERYPKEATCPKKQNTWPNLIKRGSLINYYCMYSKLINLISIL